MNYKVVYILNGIIQIENSLLKEIVTEADFNHTLDFIDQFSSQFLDQNPSLDFPIIEFFEMIENIERRSGNIDLSHSIEVLEEIISRNLTNPRLTEQLLKMLSHSHEIDMKKLVQLNMYLLKQDPISDFGLRFAELLYSKKLFSHNDMLKILMQRFEYCSNFPKNSELLDAYFTSEVYFLRLLYDILQESIESITVSDEWVFKCHEHRLKKLDLCDKKQKRLHELIERVLTLLKHELSSQKNEQVLFQ